MSVRLPVLALAFASAAHAQGVDELIRMRLEYLQATGELTVEDAPIASRNLLPGLYAARGFMPAWRTAAQIDSLLEVIEEARLEGLDPDDYHVDAVRAARETFAAADTLRPETRAGLDILLTDSVIRLGYHLRFGKVDPVALDPHWNLNRALNGQNPIETIQAAIDSPSLHEFAARAIPRNFFYLPLKRALAEYRAIAEAGGWPAMEAGPSLEPGSRDASVPRLVERLAATGDLDARAVDAEETLYDGEVVAAVRRFQERHGLVQDGVVGAATRAALNVSVEERIEQIRVNLERARWVFDELESDFVVVNIAGFRLYLVRGGEIVWRARVVVGQPYRRTPVFKAAMRYLVFNPTWTVPPTILRQDILPEQRRDPGYLASRNIDVIDDNGMLVDPASVDWSSRRPFPYRFVQRPGADNALGRVKFMFPNEHAVYLHDTPSRDLFEREIRTFSSGCIRVENPFELALLLLGEGWDQARIDALVASGQSETVFLPEPITMMLLYWTTEVDDAGRVLFLPDVYARDAAVREALAAPFSAAL